MRLVGRNCRVVNASFTNSENSVAHDQRHSRRGAVPMRITGYSHLGGVQGRASRKRAGDSGSIFDVQSHEETGSSGQSAPAARTGGLDALLSLQEVDDPLTGRRKAMARGHDLLDTLENLKADVLAGRVSPERLGGITMLLSRRESSGNPELEKVIDEIELRARVELAKLGQFDL